MFVKIKAFLQNILSENNGKDWCPIRVLSFGLSAPTIVLFLVGYAVNIYQGHFDGQNMALAFTTLCGGFAAIGAGVAVKATTDTN